MYAHHTRRRRRSPERRSRGGSLFAAVAFIFLLAVFTHFAFPRFSQMIGDKVDSVTNYRAAFSAIGEGLAGQRKITEAFAEAWELAFKPSKNSPNSEDVPAFAEAKTEAAESAISDTAKEFSDAVAAGQYLNPEAFGDGSYNI